VVVTAARTPPTPRLANPQVLKISRLDTPEEQPRRLLPGLSILALIDSNKKNIIIHKGTADSRGVPETRGPWVL
jgi:hypothetical protein